ncbi:MAG: hypothetical protein K6T94_22355 [Paenibacillus sp.]|nr:hypothetical protein [Paenibacillus sp.]
MSTTYKVLESDKDFFTASIAQKRVHVVQITEDGLDSIIDYGGPIQKYTPDTVKIADTYYMRKEFEFRAVRISKTR